MFMILSTLVAIYLRLNVGKSTVSLRERLAVHLPFQVYLGWITIASIANVSVALVSVGWDGLGISQEMWASLIVVVALLIALLVVATRTDVAYGLVVIWAFVGIAMEQTENQTIVMLTELSAIIVALVIAASLLLTRLRHK